MTAMNSVGVLLLILLMISLVLARFWWVVEI